MISVAARMSPPPGTNPCAFRRAEHIFLLPWRTTRRYKAGTIPDYLFLDDRNDATHLGQEGQKIGQLSAVQFEDDTQRRVK